jgi:hypothetical protein
MPLHRKRPEDRTASWTPKRSVRLYLDDVDAVLIAMSKLGPVMVETNDFRGQVASAVELREIEGKTLGSLRLAVKDDQGDREMEATLAPIESSGTSDTRYVGTAITPREDFELAGAAQTVQQIVASRQRRLGGLYPSTESFFQSVAFVIAAIGTIVGVAGNGTTTRIVGACFGVAALAALLGAAIWGRNPRPSGLVVLAFRSDAPTFWERNRTAILIGLATNALVGAGFFLLGRWAS